METAATEKEINCSINLQLVLGFTFLLSLLKYISLSSTLLDATSSNCQDPQLRLLIRI